MLYNSTPSSTGGFTPQRSGADGYLNFSQGIPYYTGRSRIATIPEYQRNPWMLSDDLLMTIREGRANMMRLLAEYASKNGRITKPDVKYRFKIEVVPHLRFYLDIGTYTVSGNRTTLKLSDFTRPSPSISQSTGNPAVHGDISRIESGDFIVLMFSWLAQDRKTTAPYYGESVSAYPLPEIAKVISVNYDNNTLVVDRNWAGSRRGTTSYAVTTTFDVLANTGTAAHGVSSGADILAKEAFFMLLPNSMKEDEIDAKIYGSTMTWGEGLMQRSLEAWGAGHFQEVINKNLGNGSVYNKNRTTAIESFYNKKELAAIFGEKNETWDSETQDWQGWTDGLLVNIPESHYVGLVPPQYAYIRNSSSVAWGSFDIPIFNKLLEDKGYFGSENKILLCGADFHTAFSTMINYMTQNVPDIKSEWNVTGKLFRTSNGLNVSVVPSDAFTLHGMRNKAVLMDPSYFKEIALEGYPTDIVEIQNENPLKRNGFIHGVYSFIDLNPDAHWVFTLDNTWKTATFSATYARRIMGSSHRA